MNDDPTSRFDADADPGEQASTEDGSLRCPVCSAPLTSAEPTAPFCSSRCRTIDMGRWLDGRYTVSRPLHQADFEE